MALFVFSLYIQKNKWSHPLESNGFEHILLNHLQKICIILLISIHTASKNVPWTGGTHPYLPLLEGVQSVLYRHAYILWPIAPSKKGESRGPTKYP